MTRPLSTTLSVAGLLLVLASAAHAQAPVATDACYVPASGTVYLIGQAGTPTACAAGHTQVTFQGPPPIVGVAGYETVMMNVVGTAADSYVEVDVLCPLGKAAVGGGGWAVMGEATQIIRSHPFPAEGLAAWRIGIDWWSNPDVPPQDGIWGYAYAVCVIAQ